MARRITVKSDVMPETVFRQETIDDFKRDPVAYAKANVDAFNRTLADELPLELRDDYVPPNIKYVSPLVEADYDKFERYMLSAIGFADDVAAFGSAVSVITRGGMNYLYAPQPMKNGQHFITEGGDQYEYTAVPMASAYTLAPYFESDGKMTATEVCRLQFEYVQNKSTVYGRSPGAIAMEDVKTIKTQAEATELYETAMKEYRVKAFKQYLEEIMPTKKFKRMNSFQNCMDTVSPVAIACSVFGVRLTPAQV